PHTVLHTLSLHDALPISKTKTSRGSTATLSTRRRRDEDPQGTVVRPDLHRHRAGDDRLPDALARYHHRPPGAADAGADRGGDHAGLSHRVHADGHGGDIHLPGLLPAEPEHPAFGAADPGPDGAAHVRHHDQ